MSSNNGPYYPEGRYRCEITNQAMSKAGTGTPQFVLRFRVLEPLNNQGQVAEYERTAYISITENTIDRFVEDLKTLGFTRHSFSFLDPQTRDYHSFAGQE